MPPMSLIRPYVATSPVAQLVTDEVDAPDVVPISGPQPDRFTCQYKTAAEGNDQDLRLALIRLAKCVGRYGYSFLVRKPR